jgi:hypothetical protein
MQMSMLLLTMLSTAAAPSAEADELPPEVELVSAQGDCTERPPRLVATPGEGLRLVLDQAKVETSPDQTSSRYFCAIKLRVNAPRGFMALLPALELAGDAQFGAGRASGKVSTRVFFAGARSHNGFLRLDAESTAGAFVLAAPAEEARWSSCATELALTVLIDASARYTLASEAGATSIALQEARLSRLLYRRCPTPTAPAP